MTASTMSPTSPTSPASPASHASDRGEHPVVRRLHGPVLVASDGSTVSEPAMDMARLLGTGGATIDVAAVIEPLVIPGPELPVTWAEVDAVRRDDLQGRVTRQVSQLLGDVRPAHVDTIIGVPVSELSGIARGRHTDLIITGVRTHGFFDRMFLRGETPLQLARAARRPVLVVPEPVQHLPRVVVVATDLDDASINAARLAWPLLAEARTVHLVHVRSMPAIPGGETATAWKRFYEQLATDHFDRLRAALVLPPDALVDTRTLTGHPVKEILEFVTQAEGELLVAGFRRRLLADRIAGSRSVAERLYRGTTCAMLLVPESAVATEPQDARDARTQSLTNRAEWGVALSAFSVRNAGRNAHLEIDTNELGSQAQVSGIPFEGADFERSTGAIHLMFGARDGGVSHLVHTVVGAHAIEVQQGSDGRETACRVTHTGGYTLLTFPAGPAGTTQPQG